MAQQYNRNNSKFSLNENSFNKIDSELKAYCLGFLYADGNIFKTSIRLHIQARDAEVLELFSKAFETDQHFRMDKNGYAVLSIASRKICEDLEKFGMVPNKTFKIRIPFESLEEDLLHHFMRGYFDGDGCFTSKKNEGYNVMLSLTSNFDFCREFRDVLVERAGISCNKIAKKPSTVNPEFSVGTMFYQGYPNVSKIYNFLYKDATVFLQRKKTRVENLLEKVRQYNLSNKRGRYSKLILFHEEFGERTPKATYEGLRECGMSRETLKKLISGEKKSHNGWILLCASKDKLEK